MSHAFGGPVKDYYSILGLPKSCDQNEIRRAYRRLAVQHHPDKNPDRSEQAADHFRNISEAYEVLSDNRRRAAFDLNHTAFVVSSSMTSSGGSATAAFNPFDVFSVGAGMGGMMGNGMGAFVAGMDMGMGMGMGFGGMDFPNNPDDLSMDDAKRMMNSWMSQIFPGVQTTAQQPSQTSCDSFSNGQQPASHLPHQHQYQTTPSDSAPATPSFNSQFAVPQPRASKGGRGGRSGKNRTAVTSQHQPGPGLHSRQPQRQKEEQSHAAHAHGSHHPIAEDSDMMAVSSSSQSAAATASSMSTDNVVITSTSSDGPRSKTVTTTRKSAQSTSTFVASDSVVPLASPSPALDSVSSSTSASAPSYLSTHDPESLAYLPKPIASAVRVVESLAQTTLPTVFENSVSPFPSSTMSLSQFANDTEKRVMKAMLEDMDRQQVEFACPLTSHPSSTVPASQPSASSPLELAADLPSSDFAMISASKQPSSKSTASSVPDVSSAAADASMAYSSFSYKAKYPAVVMTTSAPSALSSANVSGTCTPQFANNGAQLMYVRSPVPSSSNMQSPASSQSARPNNMGTTTTESSMPNSPSALSLSTSPMAPSPRTLSSSKPYPPPLSVFPVNDSFVSSLSSFSSSPSQPPSVILPSSPIMVEPHSHHPLQQGGVSSSSSASYGISADSADASSSQYVYLNTAHAAQLAKSLHQSGIFHGSSASSQSSASNPSSSSPSASSSGVQVEPANTNAWHMLPEASLSVTGWQLDASIHHHQPIPVVPTELSAASASSPRPSSRRNLLESSASSSALHASIASSSPSVDQRRLPPKLQDLFLDADTSMQGGISSGSDESSDDDNNHQSTRTHNYDDDDAVQLDICGTASKGHKKRSRFAGTHHQSASTSSPSSSNSLLHPHVHPTSSSTASSSASPSASVAASAINPPIHFICAVSLEEVFSGCVKRLHVSKRFVDGFGHHVEQKKIVQLHIQPGAMTGAKLTLPGEGVAEPDLRSTSDVIVTLSEQIHPRFKRIGDDLYYKHRLSLKEALLGEPFVITTLDGRELLIDMRESDADGRVFHEDSVSSQLNSSNRGGGNIAQNEQHRHRHRRHDDDGSTGVVITPTSRKTIRGEGMPRAIDGVPISAATVSVDESDDVGNGGAQTDGTNIGTDPSFGDPLSSSPSSAKARRDSSVPRGDLIITFDIRFPTRLSARHRELLAMVDFPEFGDADEEL